MAAIHYVCGPPGCGKTTAMLDRYCAHVQHHSNDSALWLAPDAVTRDEILRQVTRRLQQLYDPRIMTFPTLGQLLLDANHETVIGLLPVQRLLLARTLAPGCAPAFPQKLLSAAHFPTALLSFVNELKSAAAGDEEFAAAVGEVFPHDDRSTAMAAFYAAYQDCLKQQNLFDDPGLFWWARDVLQAGKRAPLEAVSLIIADGFLDFTTTQLHMLSELAAAGNTEVLITLPLDCDDARTELFTPMHRTLEDLKHTLGEGDVQHLCRETTTPAPLASLSRHIFSATPAEPVDAQGAVCIIEAPGIIAEAREIVREVKTLLLEGTAPDDIVLVFRSLDAYRRPLWEAAREFGVPLWIAGSEPISTRPPVQVVLDILQVISDDFRLADVVKLLKSNFVNVYKLQDEHTAISAEEFERITIEARIIGGRENWQKQLALLNKRLNREVQLAPDTDEYAELKALFADPEGDDADDDAGAGPGSRPRAHWEMKWDIQSLAAAALLFNRLCEKLAPLEGEHTREEHVVNVLQIISDLGIAQRIVHRQACDEMGRNIAAWKALQSAFLTLKSADRTVLHRDGETPKIPFAEFAQEVRLCCEHVTCEVSFQRRGRVVALDIEGARQLQRPYVFLGGLVEGRWPITHGDRPFYDDSERLRLRKKGLALKLAAENRQAEAALFYLVCSSAARRLYLSYPSVDVEGQKLIPSYYLDEVTCLFKPDTVVQIRRDLAQVVTDWETAAGYRELLERAVRDRYFPKWPQELGIEALAAHAGHCSAVELSRESPKPFDAYDGMIGEPRVTGRLLQRFIPERGWSASALGTYGNCPFAFLMTYVLSLAEVKMPTEEVEALERGVTVHRIVKDFFTRWKSEHDGQTITSDTLHTAQELMRETVDECFDEVLTQGLITHTALWELTRAEVHLDMKSLVEHEAEKLGDDGLLPFAFEAEYNVPITGPDDAEAMYIRGFIDRVDAEPAPSSGEPRRYAVYDYKAGFGPGPKEIRQGRDFQLPFYAVAAGAQLFAGEDPSAQCIKWAYYRTRRKIGFKSIAGPDSSRAPLDELIVIALNYAREYAARIRLGEFPVAPAQCSAFCAFNATCRFAPYRVACKMHQGESQ